jgi:hypothetical protein
LFGSLWVVGGVVVVFLSPGEAPDWFLVGFGITGGLAGVLAGVRPLLGPDAARLAGLAAVTCAVIATGFAIAGVWLGERDTRVVLWLVVFGVWALWALSRLVWRSRGRGVADQPDA